MRYNVTKLRTLVKIILVGAFVHVGFLKAQVLMRGTIKTSDSMHRISRVSVKNLTALNGSVSNDSGDYSIQCFPMDVIEFSKTGFETYKLVFMGESNVNITLKVAENLLDEIVVTASKSDQSLKNTSVSMEIIKAYLIENKNPSTAENTVDQIPGVQAVNGQVVIRSGSGWSYGSGSRVMVMLDGMPMLSGDAGSVQWSFLPVENIENIEVIKGASSVLFGSSALNGVINIRTRLPKQKSETKFSTFYGYYNSPKDEYLNWNNGKLSSTYGVRAFHSQRINSKNSLTLALNGFNDDSYRMSDGDQRIRFGTQYRRDLNKPSSYFGINGNLQKGKSSSFLLWENDRLAYTALDSAVTQNTTLRFNIDPYLVINPKGAKGFKHLIQGRFLKLENTVDENSASTNNQSNYSTNWFAEYQISKSIYRTLKLISGLSSSLVRSHSPLYQGFQSSFNAAFYIQANYKLKKWNLDAGMRYEHYALNAYRESKPVTRAGLSRTLAKATFFRASYGQGYRFPTIAESYILTSVGPIRLYPNPELKSETGWNAEIGIKQGLKKGKMAGILDLALFWMEYSNMMEFTFAQWEKPSIQNPLPVGFKSLNVSDALIRGLDFSFTGFRKYKYAELKWLSGYTYSYAIATKPNEVFYKDFRGKGLTFNNTSSNPTGHYLKYRPKHLARLDIQLDIKTWESGLSVRYNSYFQNIDTAFISFPIANVVPGIQNMRLNGKNGDYVMDIRVGKTFKNYKFLLLINNILNRSYMTRPCDMRPPRAFMLQVNYKI